MDSVSIVLPRPQAQGLYHVLDQVQVQGVAAKRAIADIMARIEQGLNDSPEAWWRWAQEACRGAV